MVSSIVFYLVISFGSGGAVSIPFVTLEACKVQALKINQGQPAAYALCVESDGF